MRLRIPSARTGPPRTAARRSATGLALRPTRRLPEAAVAQTARAEQAEPPSVGRDDGEHHQQEEHACLRHVDTSFLEPEILECLGRGAVEVCCKRLIAAPG